VTDSDQASERRHLRPAWVWGVWIGSVLTLVGILAVAGGFLFLGDILDPGSRSAPTPKQFREEVRADAWLTIQGAVAALIGVGMLALSLAKLYTSREKQEDAGSWASPAE